MANSDIKNLNALLDADKKLGKNIRVAFDEVLLYALERRHLDIPEFSNILINTGKDSESSKGHEHLKRNVRLIKIDEVSFDSDEKIHLPGIENALTSMRGRGYSLVFVVQGEAVKTAVYLGISKFAESPSEINAALDSYSAAWQANFPGSKLKKMSTEDISLISKNIADCKEFGVLTGIPSLKREEDSNQFVQGLERLIRAMRGETYNWISIADPIPQELVRNAISACQNLQADIHHLVHTELSKATSNGKTVMFGAFGMMGQGTTDGDAHTDNTSHTKTTSDTHTTHSSQTTTHTQNRLEGYQRVAKAASAASPVLALAGSIIGSFIFPVIGTLVGSLVGAGVGTIGAGVVENVGGAITGKSGYSDSNSSTFGTSDSHTEAMSDTVGYADTVSRAIAQQLAGGGFASLGMTWTKTTTVGQELLNRKAEYAEETLKAYETRLHEGTALGMWNLGHYFCAGDTDTYDRGIGVVTSLFTGMDSTYEPPRAIKVPEDFKNILRKFNNIYLRFSDTPITQDDLKRQVIWKDHPLGVLFNGPCTPVNTKELAIATPIATQDVEGVTVSERASFGINIPVDRSQKATLTVGRILDKGNETTLRYKLELNNLPKHLSVFGLTGSGKTNTIHYLLEQLWKDHHIPFLVIEPAKAEYRALAELEGLKDELLIISAGVDQTATCPLRMNPFDFDPGKDNDANRVHVLTHIDRLKATFNASFPMYASMPYILEEAILEIYRERGWDLGHSINRHVDIYNEDFYEFIPTLNDLYLKVDSIVQRKGYFQEQQMNIQAALKSRLSSLMVGAKGNMFNCKRSIPSADIFNRPAIVELENIGDDDEKAFLMGLLVSRLYEFRKASFAASTTPKAQPFNHVLVIEEAHRLLTNVPDTSSNMEVANVKGKSVAAFVDMLSEIRAMGQSVFVVDQLPSRVSPNIVKGTGSKIIHRLLAKDDRENVGWTMGMNDAQIKDLCLLKTGECVVSQDGDQKSFMCIVPKNELHEMRSGNEISNATVEYKKQIDDLLHPIDNIDMEDIRFRDDLYATMLAIGLGESKELLQQCCPFKHRGDRNKQLVAQQIYWQHICQEIWSFYGGDFKNFLTLQKQGLLLITAKDSTENHFQNAFNEYYKSTQDYALSLDEPIVGCAYKQLFLRKKILVALNNNFDSVKFCPDSETKLARAIIKTLPLILPRNMNISSDLSRRLAEELIHNISYDLDADTIWNAVLEHINRRS